jgi:MoxR-like ATPase
MIMEAQTLADFHRLRDALRNRVIGQDAAVDAILTGLLTNEPILLQGNAGFGQSLLATTLSQLLGLSYNQIVCSPDLTPTDIIGTPNAPGPLCAKVVLMDQIHQARPGIKALLLNVMDSRQVLLGGTRIAIEPPSLVIATQYPAEFEGSFPLSLSQFDAFLLQVEMSLPSEVDLQTTLVQGPSEPITPLTPEPDVLAMQRALRSMPVSATIAGQVARLILATDPGFHLPITHRTTYATDEVRRYVLWGPSTRGAQAIVAAAKVAAIIAQRTEITIQDIEAVAVRSLQHRLALNFEGHAAGMSPDSIIEGVLRDERWRQSSP